MLYGSENSNENIAELPEWIDGHSAQFYYIFPGKVSLFTFLFFFLAEFIYLKKKKFVCCFYFLVVKVRGVDASSVVSEAQNQLFKIKRILIISISVCKSSRVTKNSVGYFPFRERRSGEGKKTKFDQ